ncbi:hypothetical protein MAPG_08372 [Magnaporthiopsis poae ATCC 64411]|uniref:Uncharacterized protein n=1 Tax=Magnaporthiopsis poae (strain ATCC 64411 / 73-15) TaxID=644358 RepID=A0A0C4E770_MAGP6|nr:hypothetical protein MAPG_08372 [Magnaporthiopsis poae ATCC 64411]
MNNTTITPIIYYTGGNDPSGRIIFWFAIVFLAVLLAIPLICGILVLRDKRLQAAEANVEKGDHHTPNNNTNQIERKDYSSIPSEATLVDPPSLRHHRSLPELAPDEGHETGERRQRGRAAGATTDARSPQRPFGQPTRTTSATDTAAQRQRSLQTPYPPCPPAPPRPGPPPVPYPRRAAPMDNISPSRGNPSGPPVLRRRADDPNSMTPPPGVIAILVGLGILVVLACVIGVLRLSYAAAMVKREKEERRAARRAVRAGVGNVDAGEGSSTAGAATGRKPRLFTTRPAGESSSSAEEPPIVVVAVPPAAQRRRRQKEDPADVEIEMESRRPRLMLGFLKDLDYKGCNILGK